MAQEILNTQHYLYGLTARASENLNKLGAARITRGAVKSRVDSLQRNWERFQENHEVLLTTHLEEDEKKNDYFTSDVFSLCLEAYHETKAEFPDRLDALNPAATALNNSVLSASRDGGAVATHHRSLPKINLPKFTGKYQEWTTFRDYFSSLVVENQGLSAIEKLHYLKGSLSGDAARIISNIPVTEENFARAWERLQQRFENKRALVNAQLDRLFSLKTVQHESAQDLEFLRSTVNEVIDSLTALEVPVESWDQILVYFICRRLDPETHKAWELKLGGTATPPTYKDLDSFLEGRVRALESVDARFTTAKSSTYAKNSMRPPSARVHAAAPASRSPLLCACCGASHFLSACLEFRAKSPEMRRELVKEKRLCFNCLGIHRARDCRSTKRCFTCGEAHHTTLHAQGSTPPSASTPVARQSAPAAPQRHSAQVTSTASGESPTTTTALVPSQPVPTPGSNLAQTSQRNSASNHAAVSSTVSTLQPVLLATAMVKVVVPQGREIVSRALLDQGSELSFVSESVVQALQIPRRHSSIPLIGIGAQSHSTTRGVVTLTLQNRHDASIEFSIDAHILPKLTGRIPAQPVTGAASWTHLLDLDLADPTFSTPSGVDILLGANIYGHLLTEELRRGPADAPVAQLTTLGWVISGPTSALLERTLRSVHGYASIADQELHRCVQEFWEQEVVPSQVGGRLSKSEEECEDHFKRTHSRTEDGRYVVRLPFIAKPTEGGESREIAAQMWRKMQRRFKTDPTLHQLYTDFLREYRDLGHMSVISPEEAEKAYFLPHHGVLRQASRTTKLRVVFNGSQKTSSGASLNEGLHVGPKLQQDLVDILLRFRLHCYVFSADIEKMFRQVLVHPEDRTFQCILWRESDNAVPDSYQLCTLTYGLASSPYQAIRVTRQLARDEGHRFPLAAPVLEKNLYVDDVLAGDDTLELATERASQVDQLLMAGGFRLHKWVANQDAILRNIDASRCIEIEKKFDDGEVLKALGVKWNPSTDAFMFTFDRSVFSVPKITKRSVLAMIARLFDPLGYLASVIVIAKISLQSLWTTKLAWDEALPSNLSAQWTNFAAALSAADSISVPRWLGTFRESAVELHGFSDASRSALAAVVYVRIVEEDFSAKVSLLASKTKVAPLKTVTIARLELIAAVLLTQLVTKVRASLNFAENIPQFLWTDSAVALTWIRGDPLRWKEFVANRVALIQEVVPTAKWRHVPGEENPADVASRGMPPEQLRGHESWWRGPAWLKSPSTSWPKESPLIPDDVNLEEKPAAVHVSSPVAVWDLVTKYSTVERLTRVTARVLDAVSRFRGMRSEVDASGVLTPELLGRALRFWIVETQRAYFSNDIKTLQREGSVGRSSRLRLLIRG